MRLQPWLLYALLSAIAASLIPIFGKVGMKDIDSNLATTVRSVIMTIFLLSVCSVMRLWPKVITIDRKSLGMIALAGVAGATSWLFYFRAIQLGSVSQVAPIDKLSMPFGVLLAVMLLGDRPTLVNWAGVVLIVAGGYLASMPRG